MSPSKPSKLFNSSDEEVKTAECAPNIGSISFAISDSTNALFWSMVVYNLFFSILPALGKCTLFPLVYKPLLRSSPQSSHLNSIGKKLFVVIYVSGLQNVPVCKNCIKS
jgi:hypothetical protein